ncbi:alpha/beta fold hydrolase [Nibrella saemangeumensis]|uniref:Alpha/beta fold hydrolase n=1 Tax=Nibrella saemangeumensis TaxID=1084526 RepID=A0ABP8MER7_9BACT
METIRKNDQARRLTFETEPGIRLAADAYGTPSERCVVLLHGGGQTRHSWGETARWMASAGWYAISLDIRGHGDSSWSPEGHYTVDYLISDLKEVIRQIGGSPALVGASLGGIISLLAIGESQSSIASGLVLVDVAPRVEQQGVERIFRFMSANVDGFASLEEAADAVAAYLPQRPRPSDLSRLEKNLRLKPSANGGPDRYYWHWDPKFLSVWQQFASATTEQRIGYEERLFTAARALSAPTLIVRGGISDVVSEKVMTEFLDVVPHAQSVNVAEAGHMVAGDSNHAFSRTVIQFLNSSL